MCVCVCMHMSTCIHPCIHICEQQVVCASVCVCVCMCVCVCVCMCTGIHPCVCVCVSSRVCVHVCVCVCVCVSLSVFVCVHMYACALQACVCEQPHQSLWRAGEPHEETRASWVKEFSAQQLKPLSPQASPVQSLLPDEGHLKQPTPVAQIKVPRHFVGLQQKY